MIIAPDGSPPPFRGDPADRMAYFLSVAKKTTGIASINRTQLSRFPVLVPPIDLQRAFAASCERVSGVESLHAKATEQAKTAFRSLLAQSFEQ